MKGKELRLRFLKLLSLFARGGVLQGDKALGLGGLTLYSPLPFSETLSCSSFCASPLCVRGGLGNYASYLFVCLFGG